MAVVQVTPTEVKGELFAVIAGNGDLTFQLSFGGRELPFAQGLLHDTVQFSAHQTETTTDVVMVATEIDTPYPRVAITHHRTLHGIDQSVSLPQREIQTGIHPRATEYII